VLSGLLFIYETIISLIRMYYRFILILIFFCVIIIFLEEYNV